MPLRSRFAASAGADAPSKVEGNPPPARRRVGIGTTLCTLRPHGSRASRRDSTAANARSDAAYAPYLLSTGLKGRVVTASGFNAGELVKFEVENALTGVVRTYNRKANANGVATWRNATAALKYVTAIDANDNLTDTISVKRK